jgi:exo-beta-1,3-glucanase (GH17 family)
MLALSTIVGKAADPQIIIDYLPQIGKAGMAEGRVIWDGLNASNASQYAVIAMISATWDGGGDDYVKPTYDNYLTPVNANGYFKVNLIQQVSDYNHDKSHYFFVRKSDFNGVSGESLKVSTMAGRYLCRKIDVSRTEFWANIILPPTPSIRPSLVAPGTEITLTCESGSHVHYTVDGSDPALSTTIVAPISSVKVTMPQTGFLLIKTLTQKGTQGSKMESYLYLPKETYDREKKLWGLNVSLALNGEQFGHNLSEALTRQRMGWVKPFASWIRTFGTVGNGLQYIPKIADEMSLKLIQGVYITNDEVNNRAQLAGLRQILASGAKISLLTVANEPTVINVPPETVAAYIDSARKILKERNLFIPVGSADIYGANWDPLVLNKIDVVVLNFYPSTWDGTSEAQMFTTLKNSYNQALATFSTKFVMIGETGTPHHGAPYIPPQTSVTQTPSTTKYANYLNNFKRWTHDDGIAGLWFSAFDEPCKAQGGNEIEKYFGLMNGSGTIYDFVKPLFNEPVENKSGLPYPNPSDGIINLPSVTAYSVYSLMGKKIMSSVGDNVDVSSLPSGIYMLQYEEQLHKIIKK